MAMEAFKPFITSAPGKVILFGEHAVVYQKLAIAASLDLRTYCYVLPNANNQLQIDLLDFNSQLKVQLKDLDFKTFRDKFGKIDIDDLLNNEDIINKVNKFDFDVSLVDQYFSNLLNNVTINSTSQLDPNVKGALLCYLYLVMLIFNEDHFQLIQGFSLTLASRLPIGAGLGSSASFAVTLSTALLKLRYPKLVIHATQPSQIYLAVINRLSYLAEKILHGNPSGIDNTVACYGGAVAYKNGKFDLLNGFPSIDLIITDTKVPRSTKLLVAGVKELKIKYPNVIDPILDAIHNLSVTFQNGLDNQGKIDTIELLLEDLVTLNQNLLKSLNVSHPKLDTIIDLSNQNNLHSKLTGAGGGGCAMTVIPKQKHSNKSDLLIQLNQIGFETYDTKLGGNGVDLHFMDDNEVIKVKDLFNISKL